jgi:Dolichyl-phosphate-mannose-protein mannosyltransferase
MTKALENGADLDSGASAVSTVTHDRPSAPESAQAATSSSRKVWLNRGLLLCILGVQAVLSLRLRNSAFEDEALYLYVGHLQIDHLLNGTPIPNMFTSYLSGSPMLYPVLGAAADAAFGLTGARVLSLLFMLGTTALLYSLARSLFNENERVALCAAAVFAVTQSTLFLGNFATFDAPACFLLALATWIVVRTASRRAWVTCLAAAPVLALGVAVKYVTLMYLPVVAALAALAAFPYHGARALLRGLALPVLVAAALVGALAVGGRSHLDALRTTTTERAPGRDQPMDLLLDSLQWGGLMLTIALLGAGLYVWRDRGSEAAGSRNAAAVPGRWWRACLGLLLCGTALLAPAYQMYLHTHVSLHKHVGYGLLFAAPMAGIGITRLVGSHFRYPQLGPFIWVTLLVLGMIQSQYLYRVWPNSTELVTTLRSQLVADGHYLVEANSAPRYYLREQTQPEQWTSTYAITYRGNRSAPLTGEAAYRAAIADGYFDVIVFDRTVTKELDNKLTEQLQTNPSYRLLTRLPFTNSRGTGTYEIWVKAPPPVKAAPP